LSVILYVSGIRHVKIPLQSPAIRPTTVFFIIRPLEDPK